MSGCLLARTFRSLRGKADYVTYSLTASGRTPCTLQKYTQDMTVTVTEFRKNLFQLVERALNGELIEVIHKNRAIRLVLTEPQSKLSRLVQRDTLNCTPEEFDQALRSRRGTAGAT